MEDNEKKEVYAEFDKLVNMSASQLKNWLQSEESSSVGMDSGDGESVGHKSGEHIIEILDKKKTELNDGDYTHMRKVIGYIKRHLAQRPKEVAGSNWAYSLKNWGHDPEKK